MYVHVYSPLAPVTRFVHACYRWYALFIELGTHFTFRFSRLSDTVAYSTTVTFGNGKCSLSLSYLCSHRCTFSRAWNRLNVFPRLGPVACFLALGAGCMFSRAGRRLHAFLRQVPISSFPALGTDYTFSRAWQGLHVSPAWRRLDFSPLGLLVAKSCPWTKCWFVGLFVLGSFPH